MPFTRDALELIAERLAAMTAEAGLAQVIPIESGRSGGTG
jgi:hypothetical protein